MEDPFAEVGSRRHEFKINQDPYSKWNNYEHDFIIDSVVNEVKWSEHDVPDDWVVNSVMDLYHHHPVPPCR